jgi:hypothetical protein
LYQHSIDGWALLDSGVSAVLSPVGGGFLDLEKSGVLWQHSSAGWRKLDSGVTALSLAADGFTIDVTDASGARALTGIVTSLPNSNNAILDELFLDGSLWQYSGGGWALLDSGVQEIGVASDNTLVDLEANGMLYSHLGSHWSFLASGVTSFTINGNTVTATTPSGTRMFTV